MINPFTKLGNAPPHKDLVDNRIHVFIDDVDRLLSMRQDEQESAQEKLLSFACLSEQGPRLVQSVHIISDNDYLWNQVYNVYPSCHGRAHLITDLISTIYEEQSPSTIVLVAGTRECDANYLRPLMKAIEKKWRVEVIFINRNSVSSDLDPVTHLFRSFTLAKPKSFTEDVDKYLSQVIDHIHAIIKG